MSIRLRIKHLDGTTRDLELGFGAYDIGRERCHVVIDDPEVSTLHARLVADASGVVVSDMGSRNGSFDRNGAPVNGPLRLQLDDLLRVGGSTVTLVAFVAPSGGTVLATSTGQAFGAAGMGPAPASPPPLRSAQVASATPPPGLPPGGTTPVVSRSLHTMRSRRPGLAGGLMLGACALLLFGIATNWLVMTIGKDTELAGLGLLGATVCPSNGTCQSVPDAARLFSALKLGGVILDSMRHLGVLLGVAAVLSTTIAGGLAFAARRVPAWIVTLPNILFVLAAGALAGRYHEVIAPQVGVQDTLLPGPSAVAVASGAALAILVQLVMLRRGCGA